MIELLHDTKRCWIYRYGTDGKITVNKRIEIKDDMDLVDLLDTQMIDVVNSSDCTSTISISDLDIDAEAFSAIDEILDLLADE